jgi:hypothetical protein
MPLREDESYLLNRSRVTPEKINYFDQGVKTIIFLQIKNGVIVGKLRLVDSA